MLLFTLMAIVAVWKNSSKEMIYIFQKSDCDWCQMSEAAHSLKLVSLGLGSNYLKFRDYVFY